ncbi:MAG: hypothetical protein IKJ63_07995 [Clostridia bacterium]|nr:hypothetical protein [Clostridia bacterium]
MSLCACSANRPAQIRCEPATSFSCTVECTQNETAFTFDLTVAPDGNFSLYVQQPTLLQGVGFLYNNGNYTVDANGMADTFPERAFTAKSPVRLLFCALREFLFTGTETLVTRSDGTFVSQKTIDNTPVSAVLTKDGTLTQIQCPATNTIFLFTYKDMPQ